MKLKARVLESCAKDIEGGHRAGESGYHGGSFHALEGLWSCRLRELEVFHERRVLGLPELSDMGKVFFMVADYPLHSAG